MVCFQEVVETWEVYWLGRRLGRGRREFLFCEVAKGRLKMGFRRPLVWLEREIVYKDSNNCFSFSLNLLIDIGFNPFNSLSIRDKAACILLVSVSNIALNRINERYV